MKLIIQIPCYNEEETLGVTLGALPREVPGVDAVEWLVIDDGSTDRTAETAREHGVEHIIRFPRNKGLAKAFMAGVAGCLERGADIIVNTDADNQYCADDIPKLVQPILAGEAELVIGARPVSGIKHFSAVKKLLQKVGSWAVRMASKTDVADAPSGFRAISRKAAMQLNVFSEYTYTLETIIQAGQKGIPVVSVPIRVNDDLRPSRLVKSTVSYVWRSVVTILRIFAVYRPLQFFLAVSAVPLFLGVALCFRWVLLFILVDPMRARAPSLILALIFLLMGFLLVVLGLIGDLLAANRKLMEEIQAHLRRGGAEPDSGNA